MKFSLCTAITLTLVTGANAQVVSEDFENGIPPTWTLGFTIPAVTQWQAVPNGQCGAVTAMAGFTGANCTTAARGFPSGGSLITPEITLTGPGPHQVQLDSILQMNLVFDSVSISVTPLSTFIPVTIATEADFMNTGLLETLVFNIPANLSGEVVTVSFDGTATSQGGGQPGWFIDNVIIDGMTGGNVYCFGDGSGTACPCGNNAAVGTNGGCLNSSGLGAKLVAGGAPQVSADSLFFTLTDGTPNSFALLASADNQLPAANPGAGLQAFDGLRCIGGNLLRHGTRALDSGGTNVSPWGFGGGPAGGLIASGGFTAGQTRQWQVFYRDDDQLVCQTGQNQSNAVEITFIN